MFSPINNHQKQKRELTEYNKFVRLQYINLKDIDIPLHTDKMKIIGKMWQLCKEYNKENNDLKKENNDLKKENNDLINHITDLNKQIDNLMKIRAKMSS